MLKIISRFLKDPFHYLSKISLKFSHKFIPDFLMFRIKKKADLVNKVYDSFKNESLIVSFPLSVPYNFMFQRPQQLAKQFSKHSPVVYYTGCLGYNPDQVENNVYSIGNLHLINDGINGNSISGIKNKMHLSYFYLPADHYYYIKKLPSNVKIIYDYLDDITLSPRYSKSLIAKHEAILKRADLIVTTATKLYDSVPEIYRSKTKLITNGVEFERFDVNMKTFSFESKPIICFYGSLAHWIDVEIFLDIVNSNKFILKLMGPVHDKKFDKLLKHKNTNYLGYVDYHDLIDEIKDVDAFILPFELNKITMSVSPVKLFEHMATGLPIISTPIYEATKYSNVFISERNGFVNKIEEALEFRNDMDYKLLSKKVALENSWNEKASEILTFFNI